jgi:tetratricopeptide (TPR) repeat protein
MHSARNKLVLLAALAALAGAGEVPAGASSSPAERLIRSLESAIQAQPEQQRLYSELAMAYARRARETSNPEYYEKARGAAGRALKLSPADFEAQKAATWILLGKHEFAIAYESAKQLNRRIPDDLQVYGMLADACVELGLYKEAEEAVQWMLNLRPAAVAGLTRAAHLRELFGDLEGSLMLLEDAFRYTPAREIEERAWIAVHIARVQWLAGRLDAADRAAQAALKLFPGYHYALRELAEIRTAQGRHEDAVKLLEKRYTLAPHPENLAHIAAALDRAGRAEEAARAYERFEEPARQEMEAWDNANRELIAYYLGRGERPKEALRIAEMEYARRKDVYTLSSYARALHANGENAKAEGIRKQALSLGSRDPELTAMLAAR